MENHFSVIAHFINSICPRLCMCSLKSILLIFYSYGLCKHTRYLSPSHPLSPPLINTHTHTHTHIRTHTGRRTCTCTHMYNEKPANWEAKKIFSWPFLLNWPTRKTNKQNTTKKSSCSQHLINPAKLNVSPFYILWTSLSIPLTSC